MKEHGDIDIKWDGNILSISLRGPFNVEGIKHSIERVKTSVKENNLSSWYRIDYLDEETLGSPDTIKLIGEFYLWSDLNKCIESAIVCQNTLQRNLIDNFVERTGVKITVFNQDSKALNFIKKLSG
ncbi:hypothetical protein L0668_16075 [Paraglaciecola aquimarina]|uniref:STAS/SEC14 domain-containing protein n=1 Tax=Paraglaciecola algarum TaxID=3050085 RepID=A0ABS9D9L0_9ALTE|nr:hypothetical protein [Paraglaciecola sp. G1-23]MCF2949640.1 hypothetical protein [Paraglaciecola sp. G1-23]